MKRLLFIVILILPVSVFAQSGWTKIAGPICAASTNSISVTTPSTNIMGATLLVGASMSISDQFRETISDSANNSWSLTTDAPVGIVTGGARASAAYVLNPATSSTFTVTATGFNDFPDFCYYAFSGQAVNVPLVLTPGASSGAANVTSLSTGNMHVNHSDALSLVFTSSGQIPSAAPSGYTSFTSGGATANAVAYGTAYKISGINSDTPTWTYPAPGVASAVTLVFRSKNSVDKVMQTPQAPCDVTAASTSYTNVNAAVTSAQLGDVVCMPSSGGTPSNWGNQVDISGKELRGAGVLSTYGSPGLSQIHLGTAASGQGNTLIGWSSSVYTTMMDGFKLLVDGTSVRDPVSDFGVYSAVSNNGTQMPSIIHHMDVIGSGRCDGPKLSSLTIKSGVLYRNIFTATPPPAFTISSVQRTSNVITVTTSTANGYVIGSQITLFGTSAGAFDGNAIVLTTPSGTQFTASQTGVNSGPSSGGSVSGLACTTPINTNLQGMNINENAVFPWENPSTQGSLDTDGLQNVYVENNKFTGFNVTVDMAGSSRVVWRFNEMHAATIANHGYDSDAQGHRHVEIYNNHFYCDATIQLRAYFASRAGTGKIFNNTFDSVTSQPCNIEATGVNNVLLTIFKMYQCSPTTVFCWQGAYGSGLGGPLNFGTYPVSHQVGWGYPSMGDSSITVGASANSGGGNQNDPGASGFVQSLGIHDGYYEVNNVKNNGSGLFAIDPGASDLHQDTAISQSAQSSTLGTTITAPAIYATQGVTVVVALGDRVGGTAPTLANTCAEGGSGQAQTWTALTGGNTGGVRLSAWQAKFTRTCAAVIVATHDSSSANRAISVMAIKGLATSPTDVNPAVAVYSSPTGTFTSPATGTMATASNIIINYSAIGAAFNFSSPNFTPSGPTFSDNGITPNPNIGNWCASCSAADSGQNGTNTGTNDITVTLSYQRYGSSSSTTMPMSMNSGTAVGVSGILNLKVGTNINSDLPCSGVLSQFPGPYSCLNNQIGNFVETKREYFTDVDSGTSAGVRASRPNCTVVGQAYESTDQGTWNTSGSGLPGSSTVQGVLDICTVVGTPGTWINGSYTPYTYPHPLDLIVNGSAVFTVTQQPTNTPTLTPFSPAIAGSLSNGANDSVTLSIVSGCASLTGTTTITASSGNFTFTGVVPTGTVGATCSLKFHDNTNSAVPDVTLNSFTILATTYYVALTGSDTANSCTAAHNPATPKRSFNGTGGVNNGGVSCMSSGDTLQVAAGTYLETICSGCTPGTPTIPNGTSGQFTHIIGNGGVPGGVFLAPTVAQANFGGVQEIGGVVLFDATYIEFNGIGGDAVNWIMNNPMGYTCCGIEINGNTDCDNMTFACTSHDVHYLNAEAKNTSCGWFGSSNVNNVLIQGNNVHHTPAGAPNCIDMVGLSTTSVFGYIQFGSNNVTMNQNIIDGSGGWGVQIYWNGTHHPNSNFPTGTVLSNNIFRNNGFDNTCPPPTPCAESAISAGGVNTLVYNNLIYSNDAASSGVGAIAVQYATANNVQVYNNTIYNNAGFGITVDVSSTSAVIKNNITFSNNGDISDGGSGTTFQDNLCTSAGANCAFSPVTSAYFVNAPAGDFHLTSSATNAIGKGATLSSVFTTDYDGTTRTVPWDIGAYKFGIPPPPTLAFGVQPVTTQSGMTFPTFTVTKSIASTDVIQISIVNCSGTISGTTNVTMSGTTATFSAVVAGTPATGCMMKAHDATDSSVADVNSFGFDITPIITPPTFNFFRAIQVNSSQVPATQTNFTMLICANSATPCNVTVPSLNQSGGGAHVINANGYDIRPYTASNCMTPLSYRLEKYTASTGELVMWVNLPSISSSSITTFFLCYGSSTLTTDGSSTTAWDSATTAVYMLNGSPLNVLDSSANSNNGTNFGATAATGQIDGSAKMVQASNQYIQTPITTSIGAASAGTISWWSNPASLSTTGSQENFWFGQSLGADGSGTSLSCQVFQAVTIYCGWVNVTDRRVIIPIGSNVPLNTWSKYDFTWTSGGTATLYRNGVSIGTASPQDQVAALPNPFLIGSFTGFTTSGLNWDGILDQFRIANVVRSSTWITTDYNNTSAPGGFSKFCDENVVPGTCNTVSGTFTITQQPGNIFSGQTFSPSIAGFISTAVAGDNIVLSSVSGTASPTGTLNVTTTSGGNFVFPGVGATGTASTGNIWKVHDATNALIPDLNLAPFNLLAGFVTITQQPTNINGGSTFPSPIAATLTPAAADSFTLSLNAPCGTVALTGTLTVTANGSTGAMTFSGVGATGTGMNCIARIHDNTNSSITNVTTTPFSVCTASQLKFIAQPSSAAVGANLGNVSVGAYDSGNNLCAMDNGRSITFSNTVGQCTGMTLNGTTTGTNSSGIFLSSNLNETGAAGTCSLHATSSGLTATDSNLFNISAGTGTASRIRIK